jgi:succinate dehydrogenase/fumarate reductase flavoprotein subunit
MTQKEIPTRFTDDFDEIYDVVVVGFGYAGGTAAIDAANLGGNVLIVEKAPIPGGISMCSGGGIRITEQPEEALKYLRATNNGTTPDDVLKTFAYGMVEMEDYVRGLAKINDAEIVLIPRPTNYPFEGCESMSFLEVDKIPGFDLAKTYPHARGLRNGPNLFKVLDDNIAALGIEVRYSTPAVRLITNEQGEVRGLWTSGAANGARGELRAIGARQGVILACGGFEAAPEMQSQHWQIRPVLPVANTNNTGDGIRMAQDVGADLWHMWHFHGSYGFKHPDPNYPLGIRVKHLPTWIPTADDTTVPMSWVLVNGEGKRFMNEYPPYMQDTGHRAIDSFDPETQTFPHIPAYLIADEETRQMYPLGSPVSNDSSVESPTWSKDNSREVETGFLKKAETVEALSQIIGCDSGTLQKTLDTWNSDCAVSRDSAFGRPGNSMVPLKKPPYIVGEVWPMVSNTQGGARHNKEQQVINTFGEPIPRLFEAGELGSIFGFLYLGGGNLAECFIAGRIAACEAMGLTPWS